MKVNVEQFLQELEILVNMDSGQGNPAGITAVGKWLGDRLAAKGWLMEQVDVGEKTGKCTVLKNREADHYDVMLVGHVDTVSPTGETAKLESSAAYISVVAQGLCSHYGISE